MAAFGYRSGPPDPLCGCSHNSPPRKGRPNNSIAPEGEEGSHHSSPARGGDVAERQRGSASCLKDGVARERRIIPDPPLPSASPPRGGRGEGVQHRSRGGEGKPSLSPRPRGEMSRSDRGGSARCLKDGVARERRITSDPPLPSASPPRGGRGKEYNIAAEGGEGEEYSVAAEGGEGKLDLSSAVRGRCVKGLPG